MAVYIVKRIKRLPLKWQSIVFVWLARVLKRHPAFNYHAGCCLGNTDRSAEADVHFRRVLSAKPRWLPAVKGLFNALYRQQKYWQAQLLLTDCLRVKPRSEWCLVNRICCMEKLGDTDAAIHGVEQALALLPASLILNECLARLLYFYRSPAQALKMMTERIPTQPGNCGVHYALARLYQQRKEPEEALKCLQLALKLQPADHTLWYDTGRALATTNRADEGIAHLRISYKLMPDPRVLHWIGFLLNRQKKFSRAAYAYRGYVFKRPADGKMRLSLAHILAKMGKGMEASEMAKPLLRHPDSLMRAAASEFMRPRMNASHRGIPGKIGKHS